MFILAIFVIARTWKQHRCPSTEEWIQEMWYIYKMEYYSTIKNNEFMKFFRQMDESGDYHPEWGNPVTKEHTWYALTDKPMILAQKLRILLRRRNKIPMEGDTETKFRAETEEWPSRDCPTWGFIPWTTTKPRYYGRCQQEPADRSLI